MGDEIIGSSCRTRRHETVTLLNSAVKINRLVNPMKYVLAIWLALGLTAVSASTPFDPFTDTQRLEFEYRVAIDRPDAPVLRIWLPYPIDDAEQSVLGYEVEQPATLKLPARLMRETRYGNAMLYFEIGRDEFPETGPLNLSVRYRIERRPVGIVAAAEAANRPNLRTDLYSGPNPWLKSNETIREMAREATAKARSDSDKVRALYDYVHDLMTYDKQGEGWGRGDPIWACTAKRGNCTDFHSLYIAMAGEVGLTARFEIGVPIPTQADEGEIPGYHCWARVLDPARGWVPIDASEAKKSGQRDAYFGALPSDRVAFSIGRDLVLSPAQQGAGLNFFIYPYAEAGGAEYEGVRSSFHFRRLRRT